MLKALWATDSRKAKPARTATNIEIDGVSLIWRKSARRTRSLALKVDKVGQLIAMTPTRTSKRALAAFIHARRPWIDTQLARYDEVKSIKAQASGRHCWLMGERLNFDVRVGKKNSIALSNGVLQITQRRIPENQQLDQCVRQWLRGQANQRLPERLTIVSDNIGLHGRDHQIRSYTARWGSCRQDGLIQLNWKLIMVPPEVIDYVITHELCHLSHFNHSSAFWALVEQHCPNYRQHRQWLKQNASILL